MTVLHLIEQQWYFTSYFPANSTILLVTCDGQSPQSLAYLHFTLNILPNSWMLLWIRTETLLEKEETFEKWFWRMCMCIGTCACACACACV